MQIPRLLYKPKEVALACCLCSRSPSGTLLPSMEALGPQVWTAIGEVMVGKPGKAQEAAGAIWQGTSRSLVCATWPIRGRGSERACPLGLQIPGLWGGAQLEEGSGTRFLLWALKRAGVPVQCDTGIQGMREGRTLEGHPGVSSGPGRGW